MTEKTRNLISNIEFNTKAIANLKETIQNLEKDIESYTEDVFFEGINGRTFKVRSNRRSRWADFLFKVTIDKDTRNLSGSMFVPNDFPLVKLGPEEIYDLAEKTDIYLIYSFKNLGKDCLATDKSSIEGYREFVLTDRKAEVFDATDMAEALIDKRLEVIE